MSRPTLSIPSLHDSWRNDLPASVSVFLLALPLCLGIALASGAPLQAGIVSGVIGGIVVGLLSNSSLMVSGPAAGLSVIAINGIASLGSFEAFLGAVLIAGLLQIGFSLLRGGIVGYYFPSAVIKGMLAGIGIMLVLKQLPHAMGLDADFEGDESFTQRDAQTTFSALGEMFDQIQPGAVVIASASLFVMVLWHQSALKKQQALKLLPAPLVAVLIGVALNALFARSIPAWALGTTHLVQLPVARDDGHLFGFFALPDMRSLLTVEAWRMGAIIAAVASLESLLSLEATDKMDEYKRKSDANRELMAQGVGNVLAGLVGGLPVTGVVVRSAANIDSGARTRWSAILHGVLLITSVLAIPTLLNTIPLAAIASILLYTGFRLAAPALFRTSWELGRSQFVPFVVTVVAIVLTNVLVGIVIGLLVAGFFILAEHLRQPALRQVSPAGAVLRRFQLPDQATFLLKANVDRTLSAIPDGARIEIDGSNTTRFDYDVLEALHEFAETARLRNIDYRLVNIPDAPLTPTHTY
jgi:MFS superfamily sulfate permease-like transporter